MTVAEAAERAIVARLLAHVHDRPIPRELRQAAHRIAIRNVWRVVADQIADHADIERFGGRHHAETVIRIFVDLERIMRVGVAGVPSLNCADP